MRTIFRGTSGIGMFNIFVAIITQAAAVASAQRPCAARMFDSNSVVCVCNATYCDATESPGPMVRGTYYWYESTKNGTRMNLTVGQFDEEPRSNYTLTVDPTKVYQTIHGFGAAFTDSAGLNIRKLSPAAQDQLIRAYYSPQDGSGYSMGRIPIGGTDFSTRPYTYDDIPHDEGQNFFTLAPEDYIYKIPYIKKAQQQNSNIKWCASAWTAPPWMKTNNDYTGFGYLQPKYYQHYADYLIKFLDAYSQHGITIWSLSTGNEPSNIYMPSFKINSMGWLTHTVAQWIADNMGPSLEKSQHNQTLITLLDDQRYELPWVPRLVFRNRKAKDYIKLIANHWYWDRWFSPDRLDQTHEQFPHLALLMTEACTGTKPQYNKTVDLGSWDRAELYALNIIQNMQHWHTAWLDWNFALNMDGGPNWVDNTADAAIIINAEQDEFYKQPMYYAIHHFSKFVTPGSHRIAIDEVRDVKSIAFVTPSNETVVVLYNRNWRPENVAVNDSRLGYMNLVLQPYSINTIIYGQ